MNADTDAFLHRLPLLAGVTEEALQFLGQLAQPQRFSVGEVILREGETGDRLIVLCAGRVRIQKQAPTGEPVVLAEMGAGDYFGEMSLVESVPRSASVIATESALGLVLRGVDFYKLYRAHPEQYGIVILNLARDLARRLRRLDERFVADPH